MIVFKVNSCKFIKSIVTKGNFLCILLNCLNIEFYALPNGVSLMNVLCKFTDSLFLPRLTIPFVFNCFCSNLLIGIPTPNSYSGIVKQIHISLNSLMFGSSTKVY